MAVLWTVSVSNCSYLWSVSYLAVNVWFVPLIPNSMTLLCLEWEKVCCRLVRTVPLHHHFRISFWSFTIYIDVFLSVCLLPICLSDSVFLICLLLKEPSRISYLLLILNQLGWACQSICFYYLVASKSYDW